MLCSRDEKGDFWIREIPDSIAEYFLGIPFLLEIEDERVKERLFPKVFKDNMEQEEWERLGAPDLAYLFQSHKEIVERDLESLKEVGDEGEYTLRIKKNHKRAWLSALNAGRLTLFLLYGLEPEDMEIDFQELIGIDDYKVSALASIHTMAFLQDFLLNS